LGLALWGIALVGNNRILLGTFECLIGIFSFLGSIAYCLAINFKQVALYFAPAFFFYILGLNFKNVNLYDAFFVFFFLYFLYFSQSFSSIGMKRTVIVGIIVIGTFILCWLPFILGGWESVQMVSLCH
jgi:alpha-1,3-glucosyltransferase